MSYQGRWGNVDYATIAKHGFLIGAGLFLVGALGELAGHALVAEIPAWSEQLLFSVMILGVVTALLIPIVFGAVLPLTE